MRDFASRVTPALAFGPIAANADNAPVAMDLQNFDGAVVYIAVGAGGITFDTTNKIEFVLTHSDDNVTYGNVAVTDINGASAPASVTNGIVKSLIAAHATADITEIGYIGGKRYLKLLCDFSGTHGVATPICVFIMKGYARIAP